MIFLSLFPPCNSSTVNAATRERDSGYPEESESEAMDGDDTGGENRPSRTPAVRRPTPSLRRSRRLASTTPQRALDTPTVGLNCTLVVLHFLP